jgi:hypothetical protein
MESIRRDLQTRLGYLSKLIQDYLEDINDENYSALDYYNEKIEIELRALKVNQTAILANLKIQGNIK